MTRAPCNEMLWDMIYLIPRSEWGDEIISLDLQALEDAAASLSIVSGEIHAYLLARGAAGCGDSGRQLLHD